MENCEICTKTITPLEHTPGYGLTDDGKKACFDCCADLDRERMTQDGKAILYFTGDEVTNWPGTLRFKVLGRRESNHNMARVRYDYWFRFEGRTWHGYTIGNNTQIAHCRQTKLAA